MESFTFQLRYVRPRQHKLFNYQSWQANDLQQNLIKLWMEMKQKKSENFVILFHVEFKNYANFRNLVCAKGWHNRENCLVPRMYGRERSKVKPSSPHDTHYLINQNQSDDMSSSLWCSIIFILLDFRSVLFVPFHSFRCASFFVITEHSLFYTR